MTILGLLLYLAIFGLILWLIVTFIPMPPPVKTVIIAIAVIFLVLWLMSSVGLLAPLNRPIRLSP